MKESASCSSYSARESNIRRVPLSCPGLQDVRRQGGIQLPTLADCAGPGVTNPLVPDGAESPAAQTQAPVTVMIGGRNEAVQFVGHPSSTLEISSDRIEG
jgi:hypothetical protein